MGYPRLMEKHEPLPLEPGAAGQARRIVHLALGEWNHRECLDDALLIASELATNAVRYGAAPITLHVTLDTAIGRLCIAVEDAHPSDLPYPKVLTQTEPSGRGMHLISATSSRWGWDRGRSSKTVWAEIDLSTGEPADSTL